MSKLGGYAGNILKVDLTTKSITSAPLSPELAAKFIGGADLNARLAYDCIPAYTPAFSPQNSLVFGAGPLVGTLAPGAGKTNITAKSPLGEFIGSSGSGHMGAVKFAGYDQVIVTGKADGPVYLVIGDEVKIQAADHLWGKDTWETTDVIWRELGREYAVASIGPAGENLVADAAIITNKYSAFGTTGMGGVMGSKNLKAIAAYGSRGITVAEPKRFMELVNGLCKEMLSFPFIQILRDLGTLINFENLVTGNTQGSGAIAYKNCQQVADEKLMKNFDLQALFGPLMEQHGNISCLSCPVGCKHFMRLKGGPAMALSCGSAPATNFGGSCAVDGWIEVYKCAELCNRLGINYSSVASLIAMAIELYQRGIIDTRDTDGLELDWKPEVIRDMIKKISYRQGFGNLLADGLIEAPKHIGRGAEHYAIQFKGIGNTVSDARSNFSSWSCSLLTNVIGHSHSPKELYGQSAEATEVVLREMGISDDDLARVLSGPGGRHLGWVTRWTEDYAFAVECLGLCNFYQHALNIKVGRLAEIYSAATGIPMDGDGLLKAAARGLDIRKAFNQREGVSRKDDTMPIRFLTQPLMVRGEMRPPYEKQKLDQMVTEYY